MNTPIKIIIINFFWSLIWLLSAFLIALIIPFPTPSSILVKILLLIIGILVAFIGIASYWSPNHFKSENSLIDDFREDCKSLYFGHFAITIVLWIILKW